MAQRKVTNYILIGIIATVFLCIAGKAESWKEILQETAHIKSIKAEFIQHKHLKILTDPLISRGRFYFREPDSIRWEYSSPVQSILLVHEGTFRHLTMTDRGLVEDASQAVSYMQVVVNEIGLWSQGRFTESDYFKAEITGGEEERKIVLTPREKAFEAIISRIEITPSPEQKGAIDSVKIIESEDNYTRFQFINVIINETIEDTVFREAG